MADFGAPGTSLRRFLDLHFSRLKVGQDLLGALAAARAERSRTVMGALLAAGDAAAWTPRPGLLAIEAGPRGHEVRTYAPRASCTAAEAAGLAAQAAIEQEITMADAAGCGIM